MTHDEHRTRHQILKEGLLELWYDYVRGCSELTLPQTTTVDRLLNWAHGQAVEPDGQGHGNSVHAYSVCAHCGRPITDVPHHLCDETIHYATDALKAANAIGSKLLEKPL